MDWELGQALKKKAFQEKRGVELSPLNQDISQVRLNAGHFAESGSGVWYRNEALQSSGWGMCPASPTHTFCAVVTWCSTNWWEQKENHDPGQWERERKAEDTFGKKQRSVAEYWCKSCFPVMTHISRLQTIPRYCSPYLSFQPSAFFFPMKNKETACKILLRFL